MYTCTAMSAKFFSTDTPIYVEATRNNRREAVHVAHVVLADPSGNILGRFGDPHYETYERSLAKPVQLITVMLLRPKLLDECSDEEIAVMASSHSGEAAHIETVRGLIDRYGLNEDDLLCGYHPPFVPRANWELGRKNIELSPIYHNCSGKHVGMLLACQTKGWSSEGYNMPEHPMQVANNETMARYANTVPEKLVCGVDGCGVPSWWMDLQMIATVSARYSDPEFGGDFEKKVRERIFDAYHKAAWFTSGTDRFGTPFNAESDGKWLGKIGGEAVFGVSIRGRSLGIAIKVMDGNKRALGPALLHAMKTWDLITDDQLARLADWVNVPRKNAPGTLVGYMQVVQ